MDRDCWCFWMYKHFIVDCCCVSSVWRVQQAVLYETGPVDQRARDALDKTRHCHDACGQQNWQGSNTYCKQTYYESSKEDLVGLYEGEYEELLLDPRRSTLHGPGSQRAGPKLGLKFLGKNGPPYFQPALGLFCWLVSCNLINGNLIMHQQILNLQNVF